MYTRGAADHAVWAWLNEGRGFWEGVVCYGRGFLWVWLLRTINNLYLCFALSRKFFLKGRTLRSTGQDGWGRPGEICLLVCFFFLTFFASQNMKKSWHPLTLQNLERVWKAEQKNEAEQKRIAELQQEIKEERAREEMKQFAVDAGLAK